MSNIKKTIQIIFVVLIMTGSLVSSAWSEGAEEMVGPPEPSIEEFAVAGGGKLAVGLLEKTIQLILPTSKKAITLKGPRFGPKDRWFDASLITLGNTSYLEIKAASFPDGTSEINSDLWWVVYEVRKNRLKQKLSRPIDNLTEEEFYGSDEFLTRTKTEIKLSAEGKIKFILNDKEIKP